MLPRQGMALPQLTNWDSIEYGIRYNHFMSYRYNGTLRRPTPEEIKAARERLLLSQEAAAAFVHRATRVRWAEWEAGKHAIDLAVWELFLIKTGLRDKSKN